MSVFWAIASTLSGTCKKELNCPVSVDGRSLCSRKSSRASRLTRQCLPTFKHGRRPSRHQRHTVVSLTPISAATSSALSNSFSSGRATIPSFCTLQRVFTICLLYMLFALFYLFYLILADFSI